jgi:undecaprenyl-diphosphatase
MLDNIISLDKQALIFLNSLGSQPFDPFWLIITKQGSWTPFFILVFYLLYKKLGKTNFLYAIGTIALLILVCDQSANLFKHTFQRLRPCNDPQINSIIRIVKESSSFSFYSGHATNSLATTLFVYLNLKKHYKYAALLFLFPLIFAYSRIYLGLHFPGDILTGYLFGAIYGFIAYQLYNKYLLKPSH